MATFMLTLVATGLGTFAANLALLWLIGAQANKLEKQRIKDMVEQQKELMALAQKEQQRMERYAQMES